MNVLLRECFHTPWKGSYRDRFLSMMRQLLDAGYDSPSPQYLALCGVFVFQDWMTILLSHPSCALSYELESIRSNVDIVSMSWCLIGYAGFRQADESQPLSFEDWLWDNDGPPWEYEESLQEYGKLARKYQFNMNAENDHGVFPLRQYVCSMTRWSKLSNRGMIQQPPLLHCTVLLKSGANLCAENEARYPGETITLLIVLANIEHFAVHVWFSALVTANINVHSVARHAFRRLRYTSASGFVDLLQDTLEMFDESLIDAVASLSSLQQFVLNKFSEAGVHPDSTWFRDDEGSETGFSASAIDFIPATLHDPQRPERTMRRRNGHIMDFD